MFQRGFSPIPSLSPCAAMSPPSPFATNSAAAFLRQQQQVLPPGATTGYVVQPDTDLHRHASLPARRPFSPEVPTMGPPPPPPVRRPSHRAAGQPSIQEDAEGAREMAHGDVNLGRSKSWRPVSEDEWRYTERDYSGAMLSRGVSTGAGDNVRAHYRQTQGQGHVRSHSGASQLIASTETSPLDSTFGLGGYHSRTTLHKSASLRSTTSQSSNAPSHGHVQGAGGYARSVLTRGRASPGSASLNWEHLASPTFAKSEDNHGVQIARLATREEEPPRAIPGPLVGVGDGYQSQAQRLQSEAQGADVRRHQSLQQGFGHSTKVQERLARSQALLPPEQRTSYIAETEGGGRERERRTSDLSARNVWGTGSRVGGNDGWAQVDVAMRARANYTPVNHPSNALGRRETRTPPTGEFQGEMLQDPYQPGLQRDSLMQAFQAMQLGNEMLGPVAGSDLGPVPALADVYRNSLMTYGQAGYDADYGYTRALGPPVETGLPFAGYAPVAPTMPFPTFPNAAPVNSSYANVPFTQSLSQSSHPHPQAPPVVPDHIARAAEAEVHQMIANRHLNPVDFHCEPENASPLTESLLPADLFAGPLLCHQIIHRGRRAQVAQA